RCSASSWRRRCCWDGSRRSPPSSSCTRRAGHGHAIWVGRMGPAGRGRGQKGLEKTPPNHHSRVGSARSQPCPLGVTCRFRAQNNNKAERMAGEARQNLQDTYLNHVRKQKVPVTVFLVNRVKLQGV